MKTHTNILKILALAIFVGVGSACINEPVIETEDGEVPTAKLSELLPNMITQVAYNHSSYSSRIAGVYSNIFEFQGSITNYSYTPAGFDFLWSNGFYNGSLINAQLILDQAITEGALAYESIAKIMMAHELGMLCTNFGDIPYSEALQKSETRTPVYDTQESVFESIQLLLDEAIETIDNGILNSTVEGDLLFRGDMERWKKLAYGLKARFYLYTSNNYSTHLPKVMEAINQSFTTLEEQADFDWGQTPGIVNPLVALDILRPSIITFTDTYVEWLIENNDPRKDYYAVEGFPNYVYHVSTNMDLYWAQPGTKMPLLSFVELKMMEAEVLLRTDAPLSEVEVAFENAIESSFLQMEIPIDLAVNYIQDQSDLSNFSSNDEILEHLMDESYSSFYGFGFQLIWNNWRRTGYPAIPDSDPWGITEYNPSGSVPKRFLYPENERLLNPNVEAAIDRQNGALLDEPVWCFE